MAKFKTGDLVFFKDSEKKSYLYDNKERHKINLKQVPYLDHLCEIVDLNENGMRIVDGEGTEIQFKSKAFNLFRLATKKEIKEYKLKGLFV